MTQTRSNATVANACDERGGRIIDHMSTANVARDMELLRRAVGDAKLTYAGYSYGSYLGVTYANLFPDRVRALVVDGVLDPVAWATGRANQAATLPFSTRLRSDAEAQATLEEFFRLCDAGGETCAFSGDSAARYAALADRLRAAPLEVILPTGETVVLTYADFIGTTLGAMYNSYSWPFFAELLAYIESQADPSAVGVRLSALWAALGLDRETVRYPNVVEGFPGVACSETANPDSFHAWQEAADSSEEQYGYFGRLWTFASSICAFWPAADAGRYTGPWDAVTANPVLVVENTYDPATRYEGAVVVDRLLPRSRLLTVHGWGHTSLFPFAVRGPGGVRLPAVGEHSGAGDGVRAGRRAVRRSSANPERAAGGQRCLEVPRGCTAQRSRGRLSAWPARRREATPLQADGSEVVAARSGGRGHRGGDFVAEARSGWCPAELVADVPAADPK